MSAPQPLEGTGAVQEIRNRAEAQLARCRAAGSASLADVEQLVADIHALADDSNYWYGRADFFRESYRLTKGLSDDELNAQIAVQEAMRPHLPPCQFPNSPDCVCTDETGAAS